MASRFIHRKIYVRVVSMPTVISVSKGEKQWTKNSSASVNAAGGRFVSLHYHDGSYRV